MLKYKDKGHIIEINLPKEEKYKGYTIECRYQYIKEKEKYLLSMWLRNNSTDDKFKIEYQHIDTQPLSGTRETIRQNICKLVEQAASIGYFDEYIDRFKYTYKCFDKGNEMFEAESIGDTNAS